MGLIFENHQMTIAAADIKTFLRNRQRRYRQTCFYEREKLGISDARSNRDLAPGKIFSEEAKIAGDEQFLRRKALSDIPRL